MALNSFAKGSLHFKHQRLTALMLMMLVLFFLSSLVMHQNSSYQEIVFWVRKPYVSALLILTMAALFYHSFLGIKVILEDYVHTKHLVRALLFTSFALHAFLGVLSILLVILI